MGSLESVRVAREAGHPISWMLHREDTGIIGETEFGQDPKGPERILRDRKTGGTITTHRSPATILQQPLCLQSVLTEIIRRHFEHDAMAQTMARNFVSAVSNQPDNPRMALGHTTNREPGGLATCLIEQIAETRCIALNPPRLGIPRTGRS